jgi:hypothetical protein
MNLKLLLSVSLALFVATSAHAQVTRTVCASGCNFTSVNAAVAAANLGDTITVRAGETFNETVTLPVKAGSTFLTIKSDAAAGNLPPAGVRTGPAYAAFLPTIRSPGSGAPTITAAEGAHHYRLENLYFPSTPGGINDVIRLGSNSCDPSGYQEFEADQPTDIILDRIWIKASAVTGQKVGVTLGGKRMEIINSVLEGMAAVGQDSQAIGGGNGSGPYRIENNHLEGAAENVMFGGADPCQRTVMTVTGTPTTTGANVSVSVHSNSGNAHTLAELRVGQLIAVLTNGGTQRRHTTIRSITGSGTTGSITYDPISDVPDVPGDIRAGVQPTGITVRRNYFTKPLRWRTPIVDSVNSVIATAETASGTLAPGTYQYSVVALNTGCYANINCYASAQTVAATVNATGRVRLNWQPSLTATHYRIYGRTSTVAMYWEVAAGTTTFTDTGSAGTTATSIPSAQRWQIKNLFELKAGANVQIDSNVFRYHWKGSDIGNAVWLKSANQSNTHEWAQVRDVVMERNLFIHVDGFLSMNGVEYYTGNQGDRPANMTNITIRQNLVVDSTSEWADGGVGTYAIVANSYNGGKIVNLTIEHNTIAHYMRGLIQFSNTTKHDNLIFRNNMARRVSFGIFSSAGEGRAALEAQASSYTVTNNTIAGATSSAYSGGINGTISGNFFPSPTDWEAAFENYTVTGDPDADGPANYALRADSPYADAGSDGTDLGPDIPALLNAINGVEFGGASSAPVAPVITTTSPLPAGTVGVAYSHTLSAIGTGTLTWTLQAGTLPTSLTLSTGGVISGTPTVAETDAFTVRVTDAATTLTADQVLSLTIHAAYVAPTITTTTLTNATITAPYSATLVNTGGLAPFTWNLTVGSLPAGVTLNTTTGVISGTPTSPGNNNFTVQVTDALNGTDTQALSLQVNNLSLPCNRALRFQGQELYVFRRPAPPSTTAPDCAALHDLWLNTSETPAVLEAITSTTGGVVVTSPVPTGSVDISSLLGVEPMPGSVLTIDENARLTQLPPGPPSFVLESDGSSLAWVPSPTVSVTPVNITYAARTPSAGLTWGNGVAQPAARTAWPGVNETAYWHYYNVAKFTQVRLMMRVGVPAFAGATCQVEYSLDGVSFSPIDEGTGTLVPIDGDASGILGWRKSSWADISAKAKTPNTDVWVGVFCQGGNSVIIPTWGSVHLGFR